MVEKSKCHLLMGGVDIRP